MLRALTVIQNIKADGCKIKTKLIDAKTLLQNWGMAILGDMLLWYSIVTYRFYPVFI